MTSVQSAIGSVEGDGATNLQAQLRDGCGCWQEVVCLVVAVCEHVPHRLGIAFAPVSTSGVDLRSVRPLPLSALGENGFGRMEGLQSRLPNGSLSARQCEILTRLVQGQSAQDIATALYLSPTTVRNHLSTIYKKFGVHSQGALLAKFIDMRWVPDETAV